MYFNTVTLEFAISFAEVRAAFPNTSVPVNVSAIGDFVRYEDTPMPDHDPDNYSIQEVIPEQVEGQWVQKWALVELTEEQKASIRAQKVEALRQETEIALRERLDAFSQTRRYDNIISLATYANSNNLTRKAEGQYGVDARDAHWDAIIAIEAEVLAGTRTLPTVDEVMAEMPALVWPV
jgi:hypothetical protein